MILIALAGLNLLYVLLPLIVVGYIIARWVQLNKERNREKALDQFRVRNFKNEDELAWYIAHDVMGTAGYPDCIVYTVDHTDKICRQVAAYGPKNPGKMSILNPINIPFARGIVGHVAMSGKTEKIDDTTKDPRYVPDDDVRYSELAVPVLLHGKAVLVIDSEHKNPAWFREADVQFVEEVGRIAAGKMSVIK